MEDKNKNGAIKKANAMPTAVQDLIASGEREVLLNSLRNKLIECGWKDKVASYCQDVIYEIGVDNVDVDQLMERVTPMAREQIPADLKREMIFIIQNLIEKNMKLKFGTI